MKTARAIVSAAVVVAVLGLGVALLACGDDRATDADHPGVAGPGGVVANPVAGEPVVTIAGDGAKTIRVRFHAPKATAEQPVLHTQALWADEPAYHDNQGFIYKWWCAIVACVRWPDPGPNYAHPWEPGNSELCGNEGAYPSVQVFTGTMADGWCFKRNWGGPGEGWMGEHHFGRPGMTLNDKIGTVYALGVATLLIYREADYVNPLVIITNNNPAVPIEVAGLSEVSSIFAVWGYGP